MSLSEVQGKRNYSDSVPTTGIEVGELKKFLESFLLKKQTNNKPKNLLYVKYETIGFL